MSVCINCRTYITSQHNIKLSICIMSSEFKNTSVHFSRRPSDVIGPRRNSKVVKLVRTHQPTYRLNPKKRFDTTIVQRTMQRILSSELDEVEYDDKQIPELCLTLVDSIRNAVKEENYDRCRIIVSVTIGQRRNQSVQTFHTFLWDHERDNFAFYNYENCHIFANAIVYGVYFD